MTDDARGATPDVKVAEAQDVTLAANGDVDAFHRLYRAHLPRVHRLATWLLATPDVDDVIQDVFLRLWEKLGSFRGESAFGTWFHRLAVNVILRHRQKRWTDTADLPEEELTARAGKPDAAIDIARAVEQLPSGAREVFVLHDVEGYKHGDIAKMLGMSPETSRSQLHRARMLLRGILK